MTKSKNPYGFMQDAFDEARKMTPKAMLFAAGNAYIERLLGFAQKSGVISRFYEKQNKEHPETPSSLFYIVGVDEEWRYTHSKKGPPRLPKEKARVDYYLEASIGKEGGLTIEFTTSQHHHAAKKMGWERGSRSFEVSDEKGLLSSQGQKFARDIAAFLTNHAEILTNQGERRRRTMKIDGTEPSAP